MRDDDDPDARLPFDPLDQCGMDIRVYNYCPHHDEPGHARTLIAEAHVVAYTRPWGGKVVMPAD